MELLVSPLFKDIKGLVESRKISITTSKKPRNTSSNCVTKWRVTKMLSWRPPSFTSEREKLSSIELRST